MGRTSARPSWRCAGADTEKSYLIRNSVKVGICVAKPLDLPGGTKCFEERLQCERHDVTLLTEHKEAPWRVWKVRKPRVVVAAPGGLFSSRVLGRAVLVAVNFYAWRDSNPQPMAP